MATVSCAESSPVSSRKQSEAFHFLMLWAQKWPALLLLLNWEKPLDKKLACAIPLWEASSWQQCYPKKQVVISGEKTAIHKDIPIMLVECSLLQKTGRGQGERCSPCSGEEKRVEEIESQTPIMKGIPWEPISPPPTPRQSMKASSLALKWTTEDRTMFHLFWCSKCLV